MGDENSIANETFAHVVSVFESAWAWCVKNDSRFNNEAIHDIVGRMIDAHEREVYKMPESNHNAPITTELRETLARIDAYSKTNIAELVEDKLKAIDSIHANLESEYSDADSRTIDDLKAALKTQRNNFDQATSAREHWKKLYEAAQDECKKLAESIKQLESERDEEHDKVNWLHAELKGLEERSIELPKDADGLPIHIGDKVTLYGQRVYEVDAIFFYENGVSVSYEGESGCGCDSANKFHHYHEPNVEDVLHELIDKCLQLSEWNDEDELVAEYAAKLRLADEGGEQ